MNEFTASNGVKVRIDSPYLDLKYDGSGWHGVGGSNETQALREFFQHERDEANGVWRSRIDPTWTAVHENGYPTVQFRNDDGMREFSMYPDLSNFHAWSLELQKIGREYFEAHPERKPWHDAETGEVWVITVDGEESAWTVNNKDKFENPDSTYELTNPNITAARRIWPVSDD